MPIIRSSKRILKPAKAKGVKQAKVLVKKTPPQKAAAKAELKKSPPRQRAPVTLEHPDNIAVDAHDYAAVEALARAKAKTERKTRKMTAVDMAAEPLQGEAGAASMVARVSDAIERELSKIERIVGNPMRMLPAQRIETESRARVLASLARTLKEVMRLREQERGGDKAKAADDDAIPRDLDEFRRELSRRLEGLVAGAAPVSAGEHDPD